MVRVAFLLLVSCSVQAAADLTPEQLEFFEQRIRPILAENCYACHNSQTLAAAELALDSGPGLLAGGSRGPAIKPGDPEASLLLTAVSYASLDLQMPPAGKLSETEIADLTTWIAAGAPDPRSEIAALVAAEASIDFDEGRKFWAFRPAVKRQPPTAGANGGLSAIDVFLRAKQKEKGLEPASPADRRSLLRRVTFDLTGLPPTREEIASFLADDSPGAYEKVVERLLSSPHYGERWARHWLDLVRYAETNGHEFDNDKLDAWRYRDYVVDAFNQDLPYNVFVKEQIAGDLLPPAEQRLSADGTRYETPIGAGMLWLWEVLNSPTDSVKSRADQVDNQIDVLSKSLFGLTVACARCHDHKFDPIPTADYYSLGGVLHSTQLRERSINAPARQKRIHEALIAKQQADRRSRAAAGETMRNRAAGLGRVLRRAAALVGTEKGVESDEDTAPCSAEDSACIANRRVEALAELLRYAATEPSHPYYPLAKLSEPSQRLFGERIVEMREEMAAWAAKADLRHRLWRERGDRVYEDFEDGYEGWYVDGAAFGDSPMRVSPWSQGLTGGLGLGLANSYAAADEFEGILTSPKFRIEGKYVHVRMAGSEAQGKGGTADLRVTIWANDHPSKNLTADGNGQLKWKSVNLTTDVGRIGYAQITDRSRNGHIIVDRIVLSDSAEPPPIARSPYAAVLDLLESDSLDSLDELIDGYGDLAVSLWQEESESPEIISLREELDGSASETTARDGSMLADGIEVPPTAFAMSSMDVDPHDIRIHLRGNHKNLGDIAPRQFLQIIAGRNQEPVTSGSGRLELARWAASEANPLTARVMVNRIWKHHFGRGIVGTPDNFGETGDRPSHPELLDWLAADFMESGWSVKELQRRIVLSSAYRMDSAVSEQAKQVDPLNVLLSHMPVQRLGAEAIRDSILAVAGTLDRRIGGPSVPPYISEHQDGRGKPESGPLDSDGRRSIYIGVRRNFLPPLFLAFDYPSPVSTIGRRGVSAVPSQALILLNNEFVNQQAARWAERILSQIPSPDARIEEMFERAYGRLPDPNEKDAVVEFLATQSQSYREEENGELRAWSDLAHVLINSTEFIFVR
jgi:cytochrome c553/mono/diheme cytochrome c family protein